jgi:hypothetical protein
MSHYSPTRILNFVLAIGLGLSLSSCAVYDRPYGHGYVGTTPTVGVVYYDYWYYPDVQVYFDSRRGLYFYYSNNRWIETRVLPAYWRARLGSHVSIHSRHNRPYVEHSAHSRKYPSHAPKKYRIPEYRDHRTTPQPHDYHEMPRTPPPQTRPREHYEEHERDRNSYRYQPKAPSVKQPVRQRHEETPRKEPKAAVKNADKKHHGKSEDRYENDKKRDNRKSYDPKGRRDDRDRDRRDYRD